MREMMASMVSSAVGQVPIILPSRMMLTQSAMRRISFILWEM